MEKRLYAWGSGGSGQLGLGTEDDYALPQRFGNDQASLQLDSITSGGGHSAGTDADGRLYLWGADDRNQLGRVDAEHGQSHVNAPHQPVACIPNGYKTKLVACGWWSTLVVVSPDSTNTESETDQIFSWGSNDCHQLGRSSNSRDGEEAKTALVRDLPPGLRVASIACGWKHSLLATTDGDVFAWGSGRHGQLGLGSASVSAETPKIIEKLRGTSIVKVLCGWEHSVFHSSNGEVFTCGNNRHGQLGVPTVPSESSTSKRKAVNALPLCVADPNTSHSSLRAAQVSCGWHFVLCLTLSGQLVAWGKGGHGQLGQGTLENAIQPKAVVFPYSIRQIACGSEHSMVVTDDGDLYTCGWGEHGNLGHEDKANRASLEHVAFFSKANLKVLSVAAGGAVSLAVTTSVSPRGEMR